MGFLLSPLTDWLNGWLKGFLINAIQGSLASIFGDLNTTVQGIAQGVGQTPQGWNASVFTMVQRLSQSVITPVAGIILAYVACYELIALLTEKNNMHNVDGWMLFKWIFKTAVAVYLVTHTFDIVIAVFQLAQYVVQQSAGVINSSANLQFALDSLDAQLQSLNCGQLLGVLVEIQLARLGNIVLNLIITVLIYGRMVEIYMYCSIGPIPMATLTNHEWGDVGKNYLKSLFALGFQGFFMMVCVGIYAILIQTMTFSTAGGVTEGVWQAMGYALLLCFALFKTGALSKSIFNAH